jgi:branched-subunit amino acid transport protein
MEESKMKKHVTAVGAIQIGFGSLGIIFALGFFILLSNLLDFIPKEEMPEFVVRFLSYLFKALPVIFGGLSLLSVVGGIGLLVYKSWARIIVIIVAVIGCLNIPIGTLAGVYSIWVLMQDDTIKLFKTQ